MITAVRRDAALVLLEFFLLERNENSRCSFDTKSITGHHQEAFFFRLQPSPMISNHLLTNRRSHQTLMINIIGLYLITYTAYLSTL